MGLHDAHIIPVLFFLAATAVPLGAQPVPAEEELRRFTDKGPQLVAFRSRETSQASRLLRRSQIALGEKIGWPLRWNDGPHNVWDRVHPGEHLEHINRFRIERRYRDQTGTPYGADVIEIINFTATHINGIRRVLMGYLFASFEIHPDRGAYLADLILDYNRRIRTDITYVRGRYTPEVVALLEDHKLGIQEHYYYWSGQTQIIIPLIDAGAVRNYVPAAPSIQIPNIKIPTTTPAQPRLPSQPTPPAPAQKKPAAAPKKNSARRSAATPRKSFRPHNRRRQ